MSRKACTKRQKQSSSNQIVDLIGSNPGKALKLARRLDEHENSPQSRDLLERAYVAYLEHLLETGRSSQAERHLDRALGRLGRTTELHRIRLRIWARREPGRLLPLLESDSAQAALRALHTDLVNLEEVATSPDLPPGHPLGLAAGALWDALRAVTTGPVPPDRLALPEVSRRSPLAPWKLLVRAIGRFYAGDDEECRRLAEAIDPESAPARLLPALMALSGGCGEDLDGSHRELFQAVSGVSPKLKPALITLDRAFEEGRQAAVFGCAHRAESLLSGDRLLTFRRRLTARCYHLDLGLPDPGASLTDAPVWLWLARTSEREDPCLAVSRWERFLTLSEPGPQSLSPLEKSLVRLHQASLLTDLGPEELFRARLEQTSEQLDGRPGLHLSPSWLFRQAAGLAPHPEVFQAWLDWAERLSDGAEAEEAARAWEDCCPGESRALLALGRAAEGRGAPRQAIDLLERAVEANPAAPEPRQDLFRLHLSLACEHLRRGKPHLVERDARSLASLPGGLTGDLACLPLALDWAAAHQRGHKVEAKQAMDRLSEHLGDLAANILARALPGRAPRASRPTPPAGPGSLVSACGRALALVAACELVVDLPRSWDKALERDAKQGRERLMHLPDEHLLALCEQAIGNDWPRIGYRLTGLGLERGGAATARYLLHRADLVEVPWRRRECALVALHLAREQQDLATVDASHELALALELSPAFVQEVPRLEDWQLRMILDRERLEHRPAQRLGPVLRETGPSLPMPSEEEVSAFLDMLGQLGPETVADLLDLPPELLDALGGLGPRLDSEAEPPPPRIPNRPKPSTRRRRDEPRDQGRLFEEVS